MTIGFITLRTFGPFVMMQFAVIMFTLIGYWVFRRYQDSTLTVRYGVYMLLALLGMSVIAFQVIALSLLTADI